MVLNKIYPLFPGKVHDRIIDTYRIITIISFLSSTAMLSDITGNNDICLRRPLFSLFYSLAYTFCVFINEILDRKVNVPFKITKTKSETSNCLEFIHKNIKTIISKINEEGSLNKEKCLLLVMRSIIWRTKKLNWKLWNSKKVSSISKINWFEFPKVKSSMSCTLLFLRVEIINQSSSHIETMQSFLYFMGSLLSLLIFYCSACANRTYLIATTSLFFYIGKGRLIVLIGYLWTIRYKYSSRCAFISKENLSPFYQSSHALWQ